jgi:hypothetical protein
MELTQYKPLTSPGFTGREDFFFCLCPKNKALHWAVSKWFSAPRQWEYSSGVSSKILISFRESVDFTSEFKCRKWGPLFPRFTAYDSRLSGSIGKGMFYPFPALSATADPLPAHLDGCPTAPSQSSLRNNGSHSIVRKLREYSYVSINHF